MRLLWTKVEKRLNFILWRHFADNWETILDVLVYSGIGSARLGRQSTSWKERANAGRALNRDRPLSIDFSPRDSGEKVELRVPTSESIKAGSKPFFKRSVAAFPR